MTVRDLLKLDADIDIYSDYDDFGICLCGPAALTKEGKKHFKQILDAEAKVFFKGDVPVRAVVTIDDVEQARALQELLVDHAGYCSEDTWARLFEDV